MYGKSPDWHIVANPGFEDLVYEKLFNASKTMNFTVYKKEEIPELYHYKNNRRILPIFLLADEGWDIYPTFDKSYLVNGKNTRTLYIIIIMLLLILRNGGLGKPWLRQ